MNITVTAYKHKDKDPEITLENQARGEMWVLNIEQTQILVKELIEGVIAITDYK